uniref:DEP domain-containing protein n=1 Tax=Macrostomum lignano TaxID=282301 RepID=A0A1I8GJH8_9PLAT
HPGRGWRRRHGPPVPAIVQCFVVILTGYAACRTGLLPESQAKGLGRFVSTFALPSLIFRFMVTIDLSVNILFPSITRYLYLFAPISFLIINPIGFIMIEIDRALSAASAGAAADDQLSGSEPGQLAANSDCAAVKESSQPETNNRQRCLDVLGDIAKGVLLNPLVFMSALGVIFNFICSRRLPEIVDSVLSIFGNAFSATALFYLGVNMVGKTAQLRSAPFVMRELVQSFRPGVYANDTLAYSTFAFLYGALPPAPTVFVYTAQFSIASPAPELVASGLVSSTFLCAPLMYISSRLISAADYFISHTSINVSLVSLACQLVTLAYLLLSRRAFRVPHLFLLSLLACHCVTCLAMVVSQALPQDPSRHQLNLLQFVAFFFGVVGTRIWTAVLAVSMLLLRMRGLCYVLKYKAYFFFTGFGLTTFLAGIMLISTTNAGPVKDVDPAFQFGKRQYIFTTAVLVPCLVCTVASLVLHHRLSYQPRPGYESLPASDEEADGLPAASTDNSFGDDSYAGEASGIGSPEFSVQFSDAPDAAIDSDEYSENGESGPMERHLQQQHAAYVSRRMCSQSVGCQSIEERARCTRQLLNYRHRSPRLRREEIVTPDEEFLTARYQLMLLLFTLSMLIGLFLLIWRIVNEEVSGVYIELEFLDSVFNYGQGVFILGLLGWDYTVLPLLTRRIDRLCRRLRMLMFNEDRIHLPPESHLDQHVISTRDNFLMHHMDHCLHSMRFSRRRLSVGKFGANHQAGEFSGKALVDWLMSVGLCQDRIDAVAYGERLLLARVLRHEQQAYHFRDSPDYRYVFSEEAENAAAAACPEAAAAATAGDAVNRRCGRCVSLSSRDARDIEDLVNAETDHLH